MFWIAQCLIYVVSTVLIIQHYVPSSEFLLGVLSDGLHRNSSQAVSAFESGGCAALPAFSKEPSTSFALEDETGRMLCPFPIASTVHQGPDNSTDHPGPTIDSPYIMRVPITSKTMKRYSVVLAAAGRSQQHPWYDDLIRLAFPQLPVSIAVTGATTSVLVLLLTRSVVRLRKVARELSQGNLSVRVPEARQPGRNREGNEFQALVRDFNHMAEQLESMVDAQKLLLRDVSHELRSPLARISVAIELARESVDNRMGNLLDRIEREAERLNQLIGQLLTLSSIDAEPAFGPVSLNRIIEDLMPDAVYEANQRPCSVVFHATDQCTVLGDRELLYRAIENVVRNAIQHTKIDTEVRIELRAIKGSALRFALLEVTDHGPGIPETEIEAIFRPFYRIDQARSPEAGGFGVGLAIADRAVKLHCGELMASNVERGGVTFQMKIPLGKLWGW